jgi:hypothetical protein
VRTFWVKEVRRDLIREFLRVRVDWFGCKVDWQVPEVVRGLDGVLQRAKLLFDHLGAGCGIVVAEDALIMKTHGHESFVKNAVTCAINTLCGRRVAQPAFLSTVVTQANVDARLAAGCKLVMFCMFTSTEDCHSATEGAKPGNVGFRAHFYLPRGLETKRGVWEMVVNVNPVDSCETPESSAEARRQ